MPKTLAFPLSQSVNLEGAGRQAGLLFVRCRRLQTLTLAVVKCLSVGQGAVSTPVMCSDVVVYPYQIYQARLAGADALKLVAPALPSKVRGYLLYTENN